MPSSLRLTIAVFAPVIAMATPLAHAQSQGNGNNPGSASVDVVVRATLLPSCRIQTGKNPSIHFQIDPSTTGRRMARNEIDFQCTRGTNFRVLVNNGAPNTTVTGLTLKPKNGPALDALPYTLSSTLDKTTGQGFGTASNIKLTVTAALDNYTDAPAGEYDDTVTVEIRP